MNTLELLRAQRAVLVVEIVCLQSQIKALKTEVDEIDDKVAMLGKKTYRYERLIDMMCARLKRVWTMPEIVELADQLQISTGSVKKYLATAEADGHIEKISDRNEYYAHYRLTEDDLSTVDKFLGAIKSASTIGEKIIIGTEQYGLSLSAIQEIFRKCVDKNIDH